MTTQKPMLVSQAEFSRRTSYSKSAISSFCRSGILKTTTGGRLDLLASLTKLRDHESARQQDGGNRTENADLRARLLTARCKRLEWEIDVAQGKYILVDEAIADVVRCCLHAKSILLALPGQIGSTLGLEAEATAKAAVHRALVILSSQPLNRPTETEPSETKKKPPEQES